MCMYVCIHVIRMNSEDGFCLNDGNCSSPNTDCDCTDEWEGNRCHIGNDHMFTCMSTCRHCIHLHAHVHAAVCDEHGFCRNGGICLYPNVNCSCRLGWGGDACEQSKANTWSSIHYTMYSMCVGMQESNFLVIYLIALGVVLAFGVSTSLLCIKIKHDLCTTSRYYGISMDDYTCTCVLFCYSELHREEIWS